MTGDELRWVVREGHAIEVDDATSKRMAGIRQRNTKPELIVRKILTMMGHRYRLQALDLPGRPDVINRRRKWAVFVHGCYWHRHPGCRLSTTPKRNAEFWQAKFDRNVARDQRVLRELEELGFQVLTVWECETRKPEQLLARLERELPVECA